MRKLIYLLAVPILAVMLLGCEEKESDDPPAGTPNAIFISHTDCKNNKNFYATTNVQDNQSCIEYSYIEGNLQITHVNAGFNCCPGLISTDFTINGNEITIEESESEAECNCNCLYDIELAIENLQLGSYTISFVEPYAADPGQEIEFTINLNDSLSGSYCVQRDFYPWGLL